MSFMGNCIIVYALINNYPYSALLVTSHCAEKIVSAHQRAGSAYAEMVGQGEVGGVTRRVLCTWQLLGLVVRAMVGTDSLMPSCARPPAENVWWFDLNFLSLTPFSFGK